LRRFVEACDVGRLSSIGTRVNGLSRSRQLPIMASMDRQATAREAVLKVQLFLGRHPSGLLEIDTYTGVDRHYGFFCCSILALRRLFKRE
jgi:hypothetical protein